MYKDLGINDIVNDKNCLIVGLNFRAPNMQIATCQVICQAIYSAVGMYQFCKQRAANTFVILDLFHSYIS